MGWGSDRPMFKKVVVTRSTLREAEDNEDRLKTCFHIMVVIRGCWRLWRRAVGGVMEQEPTEG
jgi:hypothetical protein